MTVLNIWKLYLYFVYFKLYLYFEWSPPVPLKNERNTWKFTYLTSLEALDLLTDGIDRVMPKRTTEAISITIASAATLRVVYAAIFPELIVTEAQVGVLEASESEAFFFALVDAPFRSHFEFREMFFHVAVGFFVFETTLVSWKRKRDVLPSVGGLIVMDEWVHIWIIG